MNKRITSLFLSLAMVFTMLVTAVPALAVDMTFIKITPDKTEAHPGEIITYTVIMTAVDECGVIGLKIQLPDDLTYVADSGTVVADKTVLSADEASEFKTLSNNRVMFSNLDCNYASASDTTLCTFKCLVSNTASGVLKISEDEFDICDNSGDTISFSYSDTSAVKITSAPIAITNITLNKSTLTLTEGAAETLVATVSPENATDKTVTWSSSDKAVATVDNTGKVTAVADGEATITATTKDGGKTATCTVTVEKAVCTHKNKTEHPATPSSCIVLGNHKYYTCDDCPKVFKADGTTETTVEAETLTEYGAHVEETPATCTTLATCSVCKKPYGELKFHNYTEKIEDDAHLATPGDCQTSKTYYYDCVTCDKKGTETFAGQGKGEHKMSTAWTTTNGKHFHECTVSGCDHTADEANCSGGTATCTTKAVCAVCKVAYGELAKHEYKTEWNQGDKNGHWHDCKNCSAHDTQVAHTPGAAATETTPQTCTVCGYIIAPATGHITHTADTSKWLYDANGHWHKCIGCDQKMDETKHTGGTATCVEKANCSVCGQAYGEVAKHVFSEKIEDKAHLATSGDCQTYKTYYYDCATCDKVGTTTFTGQSKGEHKLAAEWTSENGKHFHECTVNGCDHVADEAACSGGTATCTAKAVCSVCKAAYGEFAAHEYKTEWNQGDKNGHWHDCKNCSAHDTQVVHTPGAVATETTPQTCTVCGYIIAPATGHIIHTADTSAWLYDADQHWHKCVGCDMKMNVAAHHGGTATCTAKAVCADCGQVYGALLEHVDANKDELCDVCGKDMHKHSFSVAWSIDTTHHWHTCKCGEKSEKGEHSAGEWIIDIPATANNEGSRHMACTVCGYVIRTEVIPVTAPTFDYNAWYLAMMMLYNRKFNIEANVSGGGLITPTGISQVQYGKDQTYLITPFDGYKIAFVYVDGKNIGAVTEYTFKNVKKSHKISVVFEKLPWQNPFKDVHEDDWFYDAVKFVNEEGLMLGVGTDEFGAETALNRASIVTSLWRLAGAPIVELEAEFIDLPDAWYTDAMKWAIHKGIVLGYEDDTCRPLAEVTHEQVIAILHRFLVSLGYEDTPITASTKIHHSEWAKNDVAWAISNELFDGFGSDISDLTKTVNRAEIAAYLRRLCGLMEE